ncbi:hypothetical protein NKH77_40735 [Streptomyces sp. M19]
MIGTAGPGGHRRLGRFGASLLLLVPLLAVTAASGPDGADDPPRTKDAPPPGSRTRAPGTAASAGSFPPTRLRRQAVHRAAVRGRSGALRRPAVGGGDATVFASRRDDRRPQIYLRAADGSVRKLTSGRDAAHPRLTPDGRSVVFDSAEPGGPGGGTQRDLWLVRTDGTGLTRLTDTASDEECPTVSPDGQRLAYSGNADALLGRQIWTRSLAGARRPGSPARSAARRRNRCGTRSTTRRTATSSRTPTPPTPRTARGANSG